MNSSGTIKKVAGPLVIARGMHEVVEAVGKKIRHSYADDAKES